MIARSKSSATFPGLRNVAPVKARLAPSLAPTMRTSPSAVKPWMQNTPPCTVSPPALNATAPQLPADPGMAEDECPFLRAGDLHAGQVGRAADLCAQQRYGPAGGQLGKVSVAVDGKPVRGHGNCPGAGACG